MALRVAPNLTNTIASRFEYEIKVIYLGNEVLPTEPDQDGFDPKYRCKFDLEEADPSRNVDADEEILQKDKDKNWRIVVHDNHAMHDDDDMLGHYGNTVSKPANYQARNWMRDVRPAVPFRVEVLKKEAGTAVEIKENELLIGWKISDPEEEFRIADIARNPARPKAWLQDFFKTYHRLTNDETLHGDDNSSDQFKGLRKRDGQLKVDKLLFEAPFNAGSPKALPGTDEQVKSKVVPDPDDNTKGISDVFFFPLPIGGDNYAFEITLLPKSGGTPRVFKDSKGNEKDKYETIPFTIWKKIFIDLLVTFSSVDQATINWDDVKNAYRACFTEIVKPEGDDHVVTYNEAVWKQVVKNYFKNIVQRPTSPTVDNNTYYDFNHWGLPTYPANTLAPGDLNPNGTIKDDWYWNHGAALSRLFLDRAYTEKSRTNPRTADTDQNHIPGLFMCFMRDLAAASPVAGMYAGQREFFMVQSGDATATFAHELGHAVYLRHAANVFPAANIVTIDDRWDNWLEHDQGDAIVCTMAYRNDYYGADGKTVRASNPTPWHFCGMCSLKLRFWDTAELQKNRIVKNKILDKITPIKIANSTFSIIGSHSMAKNAHHDFKALSEGETNPNNRGGPNKKDLSSALGGQWICDKPHLARFVTFGDRNYKGRLEGRNAATGSVKIYYELHGIKSNTITVTLT